MATEKVILEDTAVAGADLSAKQYCIVKLNSSRALVLAGAGDKGHVLQDNPTSGRYGTFGLVGITKVVAGGTVAADDYISSDASGHAVAATTAVIPTGGSYSAGTAGTHIVGQALKAGVSGDIIEMLIGIGLA